MSSDRQIADAVRDLATGKRRALWAIVAVVGIACALPGGAVAAQRTILGSVGQPNGADGGQLTNSRGVASNQSGIGAPEGTFYVAEGNSNHRISQFDKDGEFIRTWGYDVVEEDEENDNGTGFEVCDVTNGNDKADCKAGVQGVGAGQLNNPQGIAIDQTNGYLYITSSTNRRVDVFSGDGEFVGAFGWGVGTGAATVEVCTSTCLAAGGPGEAAGNFQSLNASIPSLDPSGGPGSVFVPDVGNGRVAEYSTTITGGELTAVTFIGAFGWDVDPAGGVELETCTVLTGCKKGTPGAGAGQFGPLNNGSPTASAVDSTGAIYIATGPLVSGTCSVATPCRVQKVAPDQSSAADFGPTSGPGQLIFTGGASNSVAGLSIAVDPTNDHVFVLIKQSPSEYRVNEYDSDGGFIGTHPSGAALPGITNNLGAGLAVGIDERVYSNMGGAGSGEVFILGPVPPPLVELAPPVESITSTSATVNGVVSIQPPGGSGFEATYRFELRSNGTPWETVKEGSTGTNPDQYPVSVDLTDLKPNKLYLVRLSATTGDQVITPPLDFETSAEGSPRVSLIYTDEVSQNAAILGAHVDPRGLKTSYHFEWASNSEWEATSQYDNRVPAFERQIGSANEVVIAQEKLDNLDPGTTYRFRVLATNAHEETAEATGTFETLNACGLTDDRCFELVSPADKGPVGAAGDDLGLGAELRFQASPEASAIAYEMAYGLPDATSGNELLYEAQRNAQGWASVQLAPPALATTNQPAGSDVSDTLGLSADLSCGIYSSTQRLTENTPDVALSAGKSNLYRREADGSWTIITELEPSNLPPGETLQEYSLLGMSPDCSRVVFRTGFVYPGVPGVGTQRLYEWHNGTLRNIGMVPGPSGPVSTEVVPGAAESANDLTVGDSNIPIFWRTVSQSGMRTYFTAISQVGGDVGRQAIFLHDGGDVSLDVSQSQTGTANDDASVFQTASVDGSQVFFLGRKGLASNGSSAGPTSCSASAGGALDGSGCDLYRYSVPTETLTDLSPGTSDAGAGVVGVIGASDDGAVVYFAARGQLAANSGPSEQVNNAKNQYSLYRWHDDGTNSGSITYVAQLEASDLGAALVRGSSRLGPWTARVTPDGGHLLFESRANIVGYQGGQSEAYLYDGASDSVSCVSCRRDGLSSLPSLDPSNTGVLVDLANVANTLSPARSVTADGSRVFFISSNRLAFGASEGKKNLYQWEDGQISFISGSPPGSALDLQFAGASKTGDELYFTTLNQLSWADTDGQLDLYSARVNGGFPKPAAPPAACNPLSESACQGGALPGVAIIPPPASAGLVGAGNPTTRPNKSKKNKSKKNKSKKNKSKKNKSKKNKSKKNKSKKNKRSASYRGGASK